MEPDRARQLAELLREMREQDGGYFPEEAWIQIQRSFALPYVELVILRPGDAGMEVFLMRRENDDPYWPGRPWHIPGGLWRTQRSLVSACDEVARRELGVSVASCREVRTHKWSDHPYGHPISHVCVCTPARAPRETESARFFSVASLPRPLLRQHEEFLVACVADAGRQS